jgi:predicted ATPase/DNA-binding CsgD family transcriptional regulator
METGMENGCTVVYHRFIPTHRFTSIASVRGTLMNDESPSPDQLKGREIEILARLSAGLSDQQIADELFLSLNTVKWYNRQIYSKLGVGSRTQAAAFAAELGLLDRGAPLRLSLPAASANLPAPSTRFIGRSREIAELKQQLGSSYLLTLTGAGGTGKSRLALRVAAEVAAGFADGVYFADLAPLSDHALVPKAITRALGIIENPNKPLPETLKRALAGRELLLLIDNFEHVIEAAPLLTELLAASPRLKVLVTSRESLRLSGEQEYQVPPLSLPVPGAVSRQQLLESEAGALFVQRAQMSLPHFAVTEDNAAAIARVCTRLDGLPLAIELAAARCKLLTPQALLERLEGVGERSPFHTLVGGSRDAPPRQQTLRDSIEWSYNLLDEGEKRLFARLAIFRSGRSLEAIEAVCAEGLAIDVFDGLASLVDKSLVEQKETPGGEPRFVLLEMIHEYARERLEASGEAERLRRRHADYFVELAERAEPELRLARYGYWCQRFELELDNLRATLEWTLSGGDLSLGVRLAGALDMFWYGKGYHVEGIQWTRRLLERLDETPAIYHAKFLRCAGRMAWWVDLDEATALLMRALDVSREIGDKLQIAWALAFQGGAMHQEPEAAMPIAEESLALFREINHLPGIAQALNVIGELARISGDDARAKRAYEECLAVCQQTGETLRTCYNLVNLAYIAQHEADHVRALDLVRQALQLTRDTLDTRDIASFLVTFAGSIAALGQLQLAAQLLGASEAALERMGAFHQPTDRPEIDRINDELRARLDAATFQKAWDEGRRMTLEQATADALLEKRYVI